MKSLVLSICWPWEEAGRNGRPQVSPLQTSQNTAVGAGVPDGPFVGYGRKPKETDNPKPRRRGDPCGRPYWTRSEAETAAATLQSAYGCQLPLHRGAIRLPKLRWCSGLRPVGAGVPDGPFVGHGRKPEETDNPKPHRRGDPCGRPCRTRSEAETAAATLQSAYGCQLPLHRGAIRLPKLRRCSGLGLVGAGVPDGPFVGHGRKLKLRQSGNS